MWLWWNLSYWTFCKKKIKKILSILPWYIVFAVTYNHIPYIIFSLHLFDQHKHIHIVYFHHLLGRKLDHIVISTRVVKLKTLILFFLQALKHSTSMETEASEYINLGVWTCICCWPATTANPGELFSFPWIPWLGSRWIQPALEKIVSPFSFSLVHMSLGSNMTKGLYRCIK